MNDLRRTVAIAAQLGFAASLVWHICILLGRDFPPVASSALFAGIFVVFLPTVIYLQRFNSVLRNGWGIAGWKHVVRGAPAWMIVVAVASFGYAFLNFFLATGHALGKVSDKEPAFGRVGSGHALVFYSVAMLVMTAAVRREEDDLDWRCERGHSLPPDGKFCGECGAPARKPLHSGSA